jgi:glutamyl-tRNA reductase
MIDIAVPRDIDPAVRELNNVFLYDMDSLQEAVAGNLDERKKDASAATEIISFEAAEFQRWFKTLTVVPVIEALRKKADQIRGNETGRCLDGKLCNLSEKEKQVVDNLTKSIVNAILKEPIIRIKDKAVEEEAALHVEALLHLFDLQGELKRNYAEEKCGEAR